MPSAGQFSPVAAADFGELLPMTSSLAIPQSGRDVRKRQDLDSFGELLRWVGERSLAKLLFGALLILPVAAAYGWWRTVRPGKAAGAQRKDDE